MKISIKFNHILIILFIILSGIIFRHFFNLLSFADPALNFEGKSKQAKFYPNSPLIQKITATENNFNQVAIPISKFSPKLGDRIVLEVNDETCESNLAKTQLDIFSWQSPNYEKFHFPAIADSQGKTYCLKLTHILGKFKPDQKSYLKSYPLEGATFTNTGKSDTEQKNRSLALKPAYGHDSTWQNFSQLVDRMSQYKPDFFKGVYLKTLFLSALILAFIIAIPLALL